ncbi:MAG: hypothetical protein CL877_04625 [Dehalococcoidales bacterium]|jgi:hypothetical protein|nr:hypothetical protein [Dehalococcoidales bacterium]
MGGESLWGIFKNKEFPLGDIHIPFAGEIPETDLLVPCSEIEPNRAKLPEDKGSKIVLYCHGRIK